MSLFSSKKKSSAKSPGDAGIVDVEATPVAAAKPAKSAPKARSQAANALPTTPLVSTEIAPFFARMMPPRRLQLAPALKILPVSVYLMCAGAAAALGFFNWKASSITSNKARVVSTTASIRQESAELQTRLDATNTRFSLASQLILWAEHTSAVQPILVACAEAFNERVQVNALSLEQKDHNALKLTLNFQAMGDPEKFASMQDDLVKRLAAAGWMMDGEPTENGPQINYTGTLTLMPR